MGEDNIFSSKKFTIATLLGTVAFVSNGFLPSPIDKMFIVIQALAFALGSLLIAKSGAIIASFINGLLLSLFRAGFFPFSLVFSLIYGGLIDGVFYVFKVNEGTNVKARRLIISLGVVTGLTGFISMFLTTALGLLPMVTEMYVGVLAVGILNGVIAGYLTLTIWNRYLSHHFQGKVPKQELP
jgi:hypothetical protein